MVAFHALLAQVGLVLAVLSAAWAAILVVRGAAGGTFFVVNLGWTVVAVLAAALVGGLMLATGSAPSDGLHVLYGVLALAALPGVGLVAAGRPPRQRMVALLIGTIVLLILLLRLFQTG